MAFAYNADFNFEERFRRPRVFRPRINMDPSTERFRLDDETIDFLIERCGTELRHASDRNCALSPREQILCATRFFASGADYRVVGDAHGVSAATVCRTVKRVSHTINTRLLPEVIDFPNANLSTRFFERGGMPCVSGCIDGTHIPILSPELEREYAFVNRKGSHSINAMAVCGPDYRFYYLSARWPGSLNDARVCRISNFLSDS